MNKIFLVFLVVVVIAIGSSFLIPGVRQVWVRQLGPLTGTLQISGVAPQVLKIYMDNKELPTSIASLTSQHYMDGIADGNKTLILNATVYSSTGQCNGGFRWYVCTNDTGSTCNSQTNGRYEIYQPTPYAQFACAGCPNCCCNYSATFDLEYYRFCGISRVNGTVWDTNTPPLTNSSLVYWRYNPNTVMYYTYVGTPGVPGTKYGTLVNLGTVSLQEYNQNKGANITKNGGNTRYYMYWNATNFTHISQSNQVIPILNATSIPPYPSEPQNSTFAVDIDGIRSNGAGYIHPNKNIQTQYPTYYVRRCMSFSCDVDEDGGLNQANFTITWHIYVPYGVAAGVYNNTIQVEQVEVPTC